MTGRLPFVADSPIGVIMKHIQEPVPRPSLYVPSLPARVERIILTALQKDPGARYQRAAEMAADVQVAQDELRMSGSGSLLYQYQLQAHAAQAAHAPSSRPTVGFDAAHAKVNAPRGVPGAPGTCFRCGAANHPQSRFCSLCGYDMASIQTRNDRDLLPDGKPLLARITFANGPLAGGSFMLHQDETMLGRNLDNDIVIQDATVSRSGHARLVFHDGTWFIEDLNSSNGAFVNGIRIVQPVPLQTGDEVRLGDVSMVFEMVT